MNIFDSFQPKKQRLGTDVVAKPKQKEAATATGPPAQRPISGLKALLLNLDNNPLTLSVSHKDSVNDSESAGDKALKAKLAHIPVRAVKIMQWNQIPTQNLSLYKQITIEANFNLVPLVDSTLPIADAHCYIYPHNPRLMSDNYSLSDFVNRNLSKTRHWTIQQSDLPYFNTTILGSIAATSSAGAALMLGGPAAGGSSTGNRSGPMDHEAALLTIQSRMLQWQEALFALLRDYLASVTPEKSCTAHITATNKAFYVLGRSLLVPANAASSAASSNGKIVSLPYTSAVFYYIHSKPSMSNSTSPTLQSNAAAASEPAVPACLLIGVHKSTLTRLQQLGAECILVEDLAHPWSHTSNSSSNGSGSKNNGVTGVTAGASVEINVAATRGTLDPHASTSAMLNNKKVGVNILVTGQYSVKVAAEVLLESVFAFVHHTGRPTSTDVPILMSHNKFAHSMEMVWDKRPVQCDYKFTPEMVKEESNTIANAESKVNKDILRSGYHKVQLQGLITSQALPHVMKYLYQFAQSHTNTISAEETTKRNTTTHRKLPISSAYSYLKHGDTSNKNATAHTDMRNVPGAVAASMAALQPRQAPQLPPVNPMVLVTTKARVYAVPKEEKEGDSSDGEIDGDDESDGESGGERGVGDSPPVEEKGEKDGNEKQTKTLDSTVSAAASATKRKLEQISPKQSVLSDKNNVNTADTSVVAALSSGELRAEKWLKQRRDSAVPYFLIQLSTVAPRCTQLSYAHLTARQSTEELEAGAIAAGTEHQDFLLLAEPLIDEIRWQADTHNIHNVNKFNENVEVVTTTQPTLRTKILEPAKSKNSANKVASDQDHDELEENGVLLDALNKYSIFVESKPM